MSETNSNTVLNITPNPVPNNPIGVLGFVIPTPTPTPTIAPVPNNPIDPINECSVITIFPMEVDCLTTNPTYTDTFNGSASLKITGGTPPYQIIWENGNVGSSITNLGTGSYKATVTDSYGDFTIITTCVLTAPPRPLPLPMCITTIIDDVKTICSISSSGFYKDKPYYRLLDTNCTTPKPFYIWWNDITTRWVLTSALGSGTQYNHNLNPGNYPETTTTYSWIQNSGSIYLITNLGSCPEPMCFTLKIEDEYVSFSNKYPIGKYNEKWYDGLGDDLTPEFYVWWNSGTTRWVLSDIINGGTTYATLQNPGNYPEATNTSIWTGSTEVISNLGSCPKPMCFTYSISGNTIGCSPKYPLGKYNGKWFYQLSESDCTTPVNYYVYWNNTTPRWEVSSNIGSGTLHSYLNNNYDYPATIGTSTWTNVNESLFQMFVSFDDLETCLKYAEAVGLTQNAAVPA